METQTKQCQNCHNNFEIVPEDFAFYEKMKVPEPTFCPKCRLRRRLAFANDRALYKRNCDMCERSLISSHPSDRGIILYCNTCWWSDKWDSAQYAQDYDPSKPFFEQIRELIRRTPQMALDSNYPTLVNSEYVNHCATAKNCYLTFTADECENVLYSEYLLRNKDSMDCTMIEGVELCYGLINSKSCYRTFFSEDCENCQEIYFSKSCNGCNNCFGCVNLRNKNYHIFNISYPKEEYQKKIAEFQIDSRKNIEKLKQEVIEFWKRSPHKFSHASRNLNVTGDYVYSSKNAKNMYVINGDVENSRYCQLMTMKGVRDAYDYTIWGHNAQQIYECMIVGEGADSIKFSFQVWPNSHDVEYGFFTLFSSYMFGCANIRNKQYCILNKQYTKEEYEALRLKIIQDMNQNPYINKQGHVYKYGEFFPSELSLVGYNESYASDYFPLTRKEAEKDGFFWYESQSNPQQATINEISDNIKDVPDSLLKEIIECRNCKKPFRIILAELTLLRRFGLPIFNKCPNCRYRERRNRINPPQLYSRKCECDGAQSKNGIYQNATNHSHGDQPCLNKFETTYSPDRPEIVYCEQCYQQEIA